MFNLKIELRCDPRNDEEVALIKKAAMMGAKHLQTVVLLMGHDRTPQISMFGGDFFTAEEEISMADDIPQDEETTDAADEGDASPAEGV